MQRAEQGIAGIHMEADYDVYFAGSLNQANDVFSRNMSSWQEAQESTSATDEIEAAVSLVVPIIFGFIVVIGLFGTPSSYFVQ